MKSKAAGLKRSSNSTLTALNSQSNFILQINKNKISSLEGGSQYTVWFRQGKLVFCFCRPLIQFCIFSQIFLVQILFKFTFQTLTSNLNFRHQTFNLKCKLQLQTVLWKFNFKYAVQFHLNISTLYLN